MSEKEILQKTAPGAEGAEDGDVSKPELEEPSAASEVEGAEDSNNSKPDVEEPDIGETTKNDEEIPSGDVNMDETEDEKKQRACRQSKLSQVNNFAWIG